MRKLLFEIFCIILIFLWINPTLEAVSVNVLDAWAAYKSKGGTDMVGEAPVFLYKVLSVDDWEKSCQTIHLSSMDADFIHLSTEEQLDRIIEKYWADASEYVLLKLEVAKLPGDLVLESNPGGTNKYYHLYKGSIPRSAVVEMTANRK